MARYYASPLLSCTAIDAPRIRVVIRKSNKGCSKRSAHSVGGVFCKTRDYDPSEQWTPDSADRLYRIQGWGAPYFGTNPEGHITVCPSAADGPELDMYTVLQDLVQTQHLSLPLVLRFPQIMCHRIRALQDCFCEAIDTFGYQGAYRGVFPVKCNHDRELLREVVAFGKPLGYGLEAGSKPELLLAASLLMEARSEGWLVCNGYKDAAYVDAALLLSQLHPRTVLVIEKPDELQLILRASERTGVRPKLGLRAKLSCKHEGHWGATSGDSAKFGLNVQEVWGAVEQARAAGALDCLQLLHFHIGSQVANISTIKDAMREASHLYAELSLLGAPMGLLDVGGGLGVDYDGTRGSPISVNYSMQNYANDVVAAVHDACLQKGVPAPTLVSESGRAVASHHAVLCFDVRSASPPPATASSPSSPSKRAAPDRTTVTAPRASGGAEADTDGAAALSTSHGAYLLETFHEVLTTMGPHNFQEAYNDALQFRREARHLFRLGILSLAEAVRVEELHTAVTRQALEEATRQVPQAIPEELVAAAKASTAIYHVNMSVFRSAPDTWAIGQVFPVLPLHRLDEQPTVRATLADLTCDSDGHLQRFVMGEDTLANDQPLQVRSQQPAEALLLHPLLHKQDSTWDVEPYVLGLFLGGAYQESMGSPHNLFGTPTVVHVRTAPSSTSVARSSSTVKADVTKNNRSGSGTFMEVNHVITAVVPGQNIEDVIALGRHDGQTMAQALGVDIDRALADGCLNPQQAERLLQAFLSALGASTYMSR